MIKGSFFLATVIPNLLIVAGGIYIPNNSWNFFIAPVVLQPLGSIANSSFNSKLFAKFFLASS